MYPIVFSFITSLLLTFFLIPKIIKFANEKRLFDTSSSSKLTPNGISNLGGIAIFTGVVISIILWYPYTLSSLIPYYLVGFSVIALLGVKDDISPISPINKLFGQLIAILILVLKAEVRLTNLSGIFGIGELSYITSVLITVIFFIIIVNAINLIDGINGLCGSIGILVSSILGTWFFLVGHIELSIIGFAVLGSLIAFLKYNISPAKIFMGDTGSLFLGLIFSILLVKFIEQQNILPDNAYTFDSAIAFAISLLIIPFFDIFRVFILRLFNGKSPFKSDRKHIHYLLIDLGFTHSQGTLIIILTTIVIIGFTYLFQSLGNSNLLIIILTFVSILSIILSNFVKRKQV